MTESHSISKQLLKKFVDRIERLVENKQTVAEDIKLVYAEAKVEGFDVKVLKEIVKRRKQDAEEVKHHDSLVEFYEDTLHTVENLLK